MDLAFFTCMVQARRPALRQPVADKAGVVVEELAPATELHMKKHPTVLEF